MSPSTKSAAKSAEEQPSCPIRYGLQIFGGKWKLPIVCMLAGGKPARYSTIKRKLNGITNVMLSQSLKELEEGGIVHRQQYNEVPPRVEYSLTEKGMGFIPILGQFAQWGVGDMNISGACVAYCDQCQSIV